MNIRILTIFLILLFFSNKFHNLENSSFFKSVNVSKNLTIIKPGIYDFLENIEFLKDKKIGIVANQTSVINNAHLVDTLLSRDLKIEKIFSPEHGFRGTVDAGTKINNEIDKKTGLPIISLYGNNKKPTKEQLQNISIIIFDLQDVGVRFYTYISTLHYIMEACAENGIKLIVLDRPNPNSGYVDGPILDTANFRSFIGMHPVPIVYGMTIGEYALMINGEHWLKNNLQCNLEIIKCQNYLHQNKYSLPIPPSPNLPNDLSIELYPTLCLLEGVNLSVGRGTDKQFQAIGSPLYKNIESFNFQFTPKPNHGATHPDFEHQICYGIDLSSERDITEFQNQININFIKKIYNSFPDKNNFFKKTNSFNLLSGNNKFKQQIIDNVSEEEIRNSWKEELEKFKIIREKYLLYM
ncbi:MAG: DUF1343 domain-containing protein [Bacteroidales bacterium]|jgi:uncharacterized protein YbbC (DUF1343 family)|nr:DUF1343 domain-containing protein [Bacteroidales bacterium]